MRTTIQSILLALLLRLPGFEDGPSFKQSQSPSKKEKKKELETETSDDQSKFFLEDEDEPEIILLKDTKHKNLFLAKMGLIFVLHFLIWILVILFIIFKNHMARDYYMLYRLLYSTWLYLFYAVIIRLIFAFAGHTVRKFSRFFYLFDLYVTFVLILGLFFYFNDFLQTQYIWQGHYIIMIGFIMFVNMIVYTLSTLITDRKYSYNFLASFIMMEITCLIMVVVVYMIFDIPTVTKTKQKVLFALLSVFNLYFTLNSHYLLRYRGDKFYDYEHIHAFFCFYTDWVYVFWMDVTHKARKEKRKQLKKAQEKREERRKAEEEKNEKNSQEPSDNELDESENVSNGDKSVSDKESNKDIEN